MQSVSGVCAAPSRVKAIRIRLGLPPSTGTTMVWRVAKSPQQAALTVSRSLSEAGLAATQGEGKYRFFVTDTTENFAHYGSIFLNQPINGQVERVELT